MKHVSLISLKLTILFVIFGLYSLDFKVHSIPNSTSNFLTQIKNVSIHFRSAKASACQDDDDCEEEEEDDDDDLEVIEVWGEAEDDYDWGSEYEDWLEDWLADIEDDVSPFDDEDHQEEIEQCEDAIDDLITSCQNTYSEFNTGIGTICATLTFSGSVTGVVGTTLCTSGVLKLNSKANEWCSVQGRAKKSEECK